MEIWLINPPAEDKAVREGRCMQRKEMWSSLWPPTSLAYVAAILREKGYSIKSFDCIASEATAESFFENNKKGDPRLIVVNTSTPTIDGDMSFVRRLKGVYSLATVVVIGVHPSALPRECVEAGADIAIIGEPERSVEAIAKAIEEGKSDYIGANCVKRDVRGMIIRSGSPLERDLDTLPFPAWDLFDLSKYTMPGKEMLPKIFLTVTPSRGCPYRCSFCSASSYYGKKLRFRSPIRVVDEIERNITDFGIRDFLIWTESFTFDADRAIAICDEIIKRRLKINWVCNSRTDAVSELLLKKMKEAGCWMISFGVESGDQDILNRAGKGATIADSERAIRTAKLVGLKTVAHTIIGLPGETPETISKTANLLNRIGVDFAQFYCAVPFPGSELYEEAKTNGWIKDGAEWL